MPAPADIQAATLDKFIKGWKKWTPEDWMATWSDDFKQGMLPFSLGVPSKSRAEAEFILPKLMAILTNYEVDIYEVVHDVARSKAAIYAISKADTPFGDFKWTNEYGVFISFTEDGTQINKMEEMLDTAFYQEFMPKFQKYMGEQAAAR
ncbi:Monooxygenase ptaG [Lachnellula suecica]|uniref:Monooxygenase ptaG n=1 Tax=Lachnellula suecica TaxID=602035 RepID=A0A8T9CHF4_9HELO|nr:Monooxygenase ptaG [Lachnellula suecica]